MPNKPDADQHPNKPAPQPNPPDTPKPLIPPHDPTLDNTQYRGRDEKDTQRR